MNKSNKDRDDASVEDVYSIQTLNFEWRPIFEDYLSESSAITLGEEDDDINLNENFKGGKISCEELTRILQNLSNKNLRDLGIRLKTIPTLINAANHNKSGSVKYRDFLIAVRNYR